METQRKKVGVIFLGDYNNHFTSLQIGILQIEGFPGDTYKTGSFILSLLSNGLVHKFRFANKRNILYFTHCSKRKILT